jgi:hypothetical protein
MEITVRIRPDLVYDCLNPRSKVGLRVTEKACSGACLPTQQRHLQADRKSEYRINSLLEISRSSEL